jgi:hypothetical protein
MTQSLDAGVMDEASTPKHVTAPDWKDEEFTLKPFYTSNSSTGDTRDRLPIYLS